MGRPKLLLPWGEGTVIDSTVAALQEGGVGTIVVVAPPEGPLRDWAPPPGVLVVVNPEPGRGMLSTVLEGLAALGLDGRDTPDPLLVCPADLPALRSSTVTALLARYRETGGVVVPRHRDKRGHPLLIAPNWQARMPALVDREGGLRRILELAAGAVHEVVVDDPGCVRDVDTPEEYDERRPR